jgi:hypothetical protein
MATIEPRIEHMGSTAVRVTWPNMKLGDVGAATTYSRYRDRSIQIVGTLSVGGGVTIKGSNDNINFTPLTDPRGNNLVITGERLEQIEDCSFSLYPEVTSGDASTDVTAVLFACKED